MLLALTVVLTAVPGVQAGGGEVPDATGVVIAEPPELGSFANLRLAIDASLDGETLLLAAGEYNSFSVAVIEGKGLTLATATSDRASISDRLTVRDLPASSTVNLLGLRFTNGVHVQSALGQVHFAQCEVDGGVSGNGDAGVTILSSLRVVASDCVFEGEHGLDDFVTPGGPALRLEHSTIAMHDTHLFGGEGGGTFYDGSTDGGPGLAAVDATSIGVSKPLVSPAARATSGVSC